MYHYIPYTATGGGLLFRDPAEIRDELAEIRTLLKRTEERMAEAESVKEEILLSLAGNEKDTEELRALDTVVEDCTALKKTLEELWERTDGLAEELSDSLFLVRGGAV